MKSQFLRMLTKNDKLEQLRLNATRADCFYMQVVKVNCSRFNVYSGCYDNNTLFYCWCDSLTLYATSLETLKRKIKAFGLTPFV